MKKKFLIYVFVTVFLFATMIMVVKIKEKNRLVHGSSNFYFLKTIRAADTLKDLERLRKDEKENNQLDINLMVKNHQVFWVKEAETTQMIHINGGNIFQFENNAANKKQKQEGFLEWEYVGETYTIQ